MVSWASHLEGTSFGEASGRVSKRMCSCAKGIKLLASLPLEIRAILRPLDLEVVR